MAWSEQTWWTLLRYGIEDENGRKLQFDEGTTVSAQPGDPVLGLTCTPLINCGDYYNYVNTVFNDFTLWSSKYKNIEIEGNLYNIDRIVLNKEGGTQQATIRYVDENGIYVGPPLGLDGNFNLCSAEIEGVTVITTDIFINLVAYIDLSGDIQASFSLTGKITSARKQEYPVIAAYDYLFNPTGTALPFTENYFDAQLNGNYWDPSGNAGQPGETGGGLGDYRRPDYEIGIPTLPEVSAADTGFIGIYEVTASEIQDLAADLWTDNFWQTIIKNFEDPFNNIISLSLIPYDQLTGTLTQIMVGNFQSSAAGHKLATTFYEVDCGIININEYYGTYADYTLTKIQLYLPFCHTIEINPDDVMDGKIRVVYHVDIFSGCCVAYVQTITKGAWHVLYQIEGNIKSELPINARNYMGVYTGLAKGMLGMVGAAASGNIMGAAGSAIDTIASAKPSYQRSGSGGGSAAMLGILYPYLIFSTPQIFIPDNFKKLKGYISNQKVKIGDQTGYLSAAVTNDDLINFNATVEEKSMIASLLSEGIRIEKED